MFWDHDDKWCSNTLGPNEMDFQFSILHPHVGFHQFKEGVSRMKQFMGREHKDVECYLVGVIAGGGTDKFVITIWSLMDFHYLEQVPKSDDHVNELMEKALELCHEYT